MTKLRHLDVSQWSDLTPASHLGTFADPTNFLTRLVDSLPELKSLDLSGTNLPSQSIDPSEEDSALLKSFYRKHDIKDLTVFRVTRKTLMPLSIMEFSIKMSKKKKSWSPSILTCLLRSVSTWRRASSTIDWWKTTDARRGQTTELQRTPPTAGDNPQAVSWTAGKDTYLGATKTLTPLANKVSQTSQPRWERHCRDVFDFVFPLRPNALS